MVKCRNHKAFMMMLRRSLTAALPALTVLFTACGNPITEPPATSLHAEVTGAIEASVTAAAYWHTGTMPGGVMRFQMTSNSGGDFVLNWDRSGKPPAGEYPLALMNADRMHFGQISTQRFFAADSGSIRITRWLSDDIATGTFKFEAVQWCGPPLDSSGCVRPAQTNPDLPRVAITGTFVMERSADVGVHDGLRLPTP